MVWREEIHPPVFSTGGNSRHLCSTSPLIGTLHFHPLIIFLVDGKLHYPVDDNGGDTAIVDKGWGINDINSESMPKLGIKIAAYKNYYGQSTWRSHISDSRLLR